MRSTYKQFYYINRGRVKADGTTSIFCRITIDGKVSAIAVFTVLPKNGTRKKVKPRMQE